MVLRLEPLEPGEGFEFVNKVVGGAIPREYIPAAERGVQEAMQRGISAGYPVTDVRVTLMDGSYHEVDSSDMAFKIAASLGFKDLASQANPIALEPIMSIEVVLPEEFLGDVIGDISSRRGKVLGTEVKGRSQVIRAQVPLAEVLRYAVDLESITGGRGHFTISFSSYEEVPSNLAEKIIADATVAQDE